MTLTIDAALAALAENIGHIEARRALAQHALDAGDAATALRLCGDIADAGLMAIAANALLAAGNEMAAQARWAQLAALDPTHPAGQIAAARIALAEGNFAEASRLAAALPSSTEAAIVQAEIALAKDDIEAAVETVRAASDPAPAFVVARQLLKRGHLGRAYGLLQARNRDEASASARSEVASLARDLRAYVRDLKQQAGDVDRLKDFTVRATLALIDPNEAESARKAAAMLGKSLRQQIEAGDRAGAQIALAQAQTIWPDDPQFRSLESLLASKTQHMPPTAAGPTDRADADQMPAMASPGDSPANDTRPAADTAPGHGSGQPPLIAAARRLLASGELAALHALVRSAEADLAATGLARDLRAYVRDLKQKPGDFDGLANFLARASLALLMPTETDSVAKAITLLERSVKRQAEAGDHAGAMATLLEARQVSPSNPKLLAMQSMLIQMAQRQEAAAAAVEPAQMDSRAPAPVIPSRGEEVASGPAIGTDLVDKTIAKVAKIIEAATNTRLAAGDIDGAEAILLRLRRISDTDSRLRGLAARVKAVRNGRLDDGDEDDVPADRNGVELA